MKIYVPFTLYFNDNNLYDKPPDLLFPVIYFYYIAFTSADIIFHKFLELHSTSDKKFFVTNLYFFNGFTRKPPPVPHSPPLPYFVKGFQPPPPPNPLFKAPTL